MSENTDCDLNGSYILINEDLYGWEEVKKLVARITELEAEREKVRGLIDAVVESKVWYSVLRSLYCTVDEKAIDDLAAYRRENK